MLLPDGADSTLVSLVATQTLTNKTLTTPKIAEIDSLSSGNITLDAEADIVLDAGGADINLAVAGTTFGSLTNLSDNFKIKSTISDEDIIFMGSDGGVEITALTLDMSSGGAAQFIKDISIGDGRYIGSASDADAIQIAANGVVTFSQNPVFPDGGVDLVDIDIDGGTDIGADLTTSDLIVVDDGAGGTNRKAALSRVVTLMTAQGFVTDDPTALAIALG